ncbi:hypothetical protein LCGC14_2326820 [marine sediment metagenome]|uniref:Uncharacterized protein n=1 Tax=marine sediment metagenome TaxID=412755 RepID=A0A0F9D3P5_9ZZZZ
MKTTTSIKSEELSKEDLQALLQAIRDCEMATFPEKVIYITIEAPDMTMEDMTELLRSIKPPYDIGPVVLNIRDK